MLLIDEEMWPDLSREERIDLSNGIGRPIFIVSIIDVITDVAIQLTSCVSMLL